MNKLKSIVIMVAVLAIAVLSVMSFATLGLAVIGLSAFVLLIASVYRMFTGSRVINPVVKTY